MSPLDVLIIGGGPGGLCLAQGLQKKGISFAVYERERSLTSRYGYRVHINPVGSMALNTCLPKQLHKSFVDTCGSSVGKLTFLTERMDKLLVVDFPQRDPVNSHKSVSRITLRQVLLAGLEDAVHFEKAFTRYFFRDDGKIVAEFADGSCVAGDVLVGADGGSSRVRNQFLPHAQRIDTGVVSIGGKLILDGANSNGIPREFLDGIALVSAEGGLGMFIAPQIFANGNAQNTGFGGNDAAYSPAMGPLFDNTKSYVMWALGGRREALLPKETAQSLGGEALKRIAQAKASGWHTDLRNLIAKSDPATVSCLPIRTSVPVDPWPTKRVTLLGDAIHSMTPYRGIGANVALRDAANLCQALCAANAGETDLLPAIHAYESEMIRYGFRAVRQSLRAMEQLLDDHTVRRTISRASFKMLQSLPPKVKNWVFRRMGED